MDNLQIHIDPGSGFCFGVVYAIEMAEEILDQEGQLFCLGDIVHNDREVKRLQKKGLQIITHEELAGIFDAKVMIRAHGEAPETYKLAIQNRLQLVDASCPVILKLQNRIRTSYERKEHILIFGKADHAEVIGLAGQTQNKAVVFEHTDELNLDHLPKEVTLYSQSTKNKQSFYSALAHLKKSGLSVKAHDTICRQVSNRDSELQEFAKQHEVIIFVSGQKSSNGRMLFQVCQATNPQSYFVSGPEQIKAEWVMGKTSVGICGATSTPQWLMEEVKAHIETLHTPDAEERLKAV